MFPSNPKCTILGGVKRQHHIRDNKNNILYMSSLDHPYSTRWCARSLFFMREENCTCNKIQFYYFILRTTINTKQAVNKLFKKLITKAIYCQVQDCVKAKQHWKVEGPTFQIFSPSSSLLATLLAGLLAEEPIWSTYFTIQCPSSRWKQLKIACDWGHLCIHYSGKHYVFDWGHFQSKS